MVMIFDNKKLIFDIKKLFKSLRGMDASQNLMIHLLYHNVHNQCKLHIETEKDFSIPLRRVHSLW